jgi:hypothetical protein
MASNERLREAPDCLQVPEPGWAAFSKKSTWSQKLIRTRSSFCFKALQLLSSSCSFKAGTTLTSDLAASTLEHLGSGCQQATRRHGRSIPTKRGDYNFVGLRIFQGESQRRTRRDCGLNSSIMNILLTTPMSCRSWLLQHPLLFLSRQQKNNEQHHHYGHSLVHSGTKKQ